MFGVFLIENTNFIFFFSEELDKQARGTGAGQGGQQGHPMPERVWLKAGESLQICGVSPFLDVPIAEITLSLIFSPFPLPRMETVAFPQRG